MYSNDNKPTGAFIGASWVAFIVGTGGFLAALWSSDLLLAQKGFYFTLLMYGLFSAISLQKSIRDKLEGIAVTDLYFGLCWLSFVGSTATLIIGLWVAPYTISVKGMFMMSFLLSLFGAVTIQKNVRDLVTK